MIAFALALAQVDAGNPYWKYVPGPFNLIVKWGPGAPMAIRYETAQRCELAAVQVLSEGDPIVGKDGKPRPVPPQFQGPNRPYAFCVPG